MVNRRGAPPGSAGRRFAHKGPDCGYPPAGTPHSWPWHVLRPVTREPAGTRSAEPAAVVGTARPDRPWPAGSAPRPPDHTARPGSTASADGWRPAADCPPDPAPVAAGAGA